jgi:hypothetical protein
MQIKSPRDVIEALGGVEAVAELTGANLATVYKWHQPGTQTLPAKTYVIMISALLVQGDGAVPRLWGMIE